MARKVGILKYLMRYLGNGEVPTLQADKSNKLNGTQEKCSEGYEETGARSR